MSHFKFDYSMAADFYDGESFNKLLKEAGDAEEKLHSGSGAGSGFTGWLNLPDNYERYEIEKIKETAAEIREKADSLIVIGIGGSYLGARSAIEALDDQLEIKGESDGNKKFPSIMYAGNNISAAYLARLLKLVNEQDVVLNVVSKSGATLEPAIAFRVLREAMEQKYGTGNLKDRIICTTDKGKGVLKGIADNEGYKTFVIPDDIGGRYSVLTPVGLLPIAVAGIDIDEIMAGATEALHICKTENPRDNPACCYAAIRNLFYSMGKTIEVMASYEPSFQYIARWWQQLFGESEGKEGKGIYPAELTFSTDLHSMGQYLQEGRRDIFLTTLWAESPVTDIMIPRGTYHDGLEFIEGKSMHYVNEQAFCGTVKAHSEGGVPNLLVKVPQMTPFYYGELVYFFQKACAISGYLLGVNPFDQPGVEAYKKNMYSLLGK